MAHGRPQPVRLGVVETLIDNTDDAGFFSSLGGSYRFARRPKSRRDSLQNALGELEGVDANGRVKGLLDIRNSKMSARLLAFT
jgi:hypothetical protein